MNDCRGCWYYRQFVKARENDDDLVLAHACIVFADDVNAPVYEIKNVEVGCEAFFSLSEQINE